MPVRDDWGPDEIVHPEDMNSYGSEINQQATQLVPPGGQSGNILVKNSGTNFDVSWGTDPSVDTKISAHNASGAAHSDLRARLMPTGGTPGQHPTPLTAGGYGWENPGRRFRNLSTDSTLWYKLASVRLPAGNTAAMLSCHVSTDPSGGNNLSGAFTLTTRNNTEGTVIASFIWEYIYGFDPQSFVLLWKFDGAALDAEIWYKPKTTNQYLVLDVMSESGFNAPVYGTRVLTNLWAFFSNDPGVPDLPTGYTQVVSQLPTYDYNVRAAIQIADRIYEGEDLTARWASEIGGTRFNGNVAAWAQARIKAGDWRGIHVGDYIPITCKNNVKLNMRANINTYKNWGDVAIGNHIDWISLEYWPELIIYNLVDYNNGTTVSPYPWLSCYLYANLNGLKMLVPNSAIASPSMIEVDFTGRGIIDQLPDEWQAVIVQKRARLPQRYTAGALLTNDNNWGWSNAGKLWIPSEVERYGTEHWGSKNGFSGAANRQYQVFADTPELVRSNSWMMGSAGNDSRSVIVNGRNGGSDRLPASTMAPAVPICFRVA